MSTLNLLALAILLPMFGTFFRAQPGILDREIAVTPGTYSGLQLIEVLSKNGIAVSYSQSALTNQDVTTTADSIKVKELLDKLFDSGQYNYIIRRNKILVVPRKGDATPSHSGGFFNGHDGSFPPINPTYVV